MAEHMRMGAIKYGPNNWRQGLMVSRIVSAIRRHALQLLEDNGENHAAAILCETAFLIQTVTDIKTGLLPAELDDGFPHKGTELNLYGR